MPAHLLHNSARVLEFDSLRELLRGYCSSPLGHARVAALAPLTDAAWIQTQQALATEIGESRRVAGRCDLSSLSYIGWLGGRARIAGVALGRIEVRDVRFAVARAGGSRV